MGYVLGVDLGTTYTAAATWDPADGQARMLGLGNRALQIPSVLYRQADGTFLVGETAERRGAADPANVVREFKRRIGDHVPILIGNTPYSPQTLTARLLRWVVDQATERIGSPPDSITLTYPANWGNFKIDLLLQAASLADLDDVTTCSEPEAAARQYAAANTVNDGDRICVYDLGGGTFDAAVLLRTPNGFHTIGTPEGIEHLGGIDFDEAVFRRVLDDLPGDVTDLDLSDPTEMAALARLRRDCTEAKEALSTDVDTIVDVALGPHRTTVRLTRAEFEDMIRPALQDTIGSTSRALRSADTNPADLTTFVLVGGSSRIPLVTETLTSAFRRPVARNTHPKHDIALGAARTIPAAAGQPPPSWPAAQQVNRPATPLIPPPVPRPAGQTGPQAVVTASLVVPQAPVDTAEALPTEIIDVDASLAGYQQPRRTAEGERPSWPTVPEQPAPPLDVPPYQYSPGQHGASQHGASQYGPGQYEQPPPGSGQFGPGGPPPNGVAPAGPVGPAGPLPPRDPATATAQRNRILLIVGAAAVVVAIVAGVVLFIGRNGQDTPTAGNGVQTTSSASPSSATAASSATTSSSLTSAAPTSSAPASPSALPLTVDIPQGPALSDQTVIAPRTVDGKSVMFMVDARTGAITNQLGGVVGGVPAVSPDQRSIIYVSTNDQNNTALRIVGTDGQGDRWLFSNPPTGCERMFRPAWNPMDPNEIAAACDNQDGTKYTLNIIGLDGAVRRTLPVGQDTMDDPSWSPDGKTLTFWAGPSSPLGGGIYTMAADGQHPPVQLTDGKEGDGDPMFSPDGKQIAFRRWNFDATGKNTDVDILVMSADGSGLRALARHPGNDQDPAWSPDGKQIVWKSSRADGEAVGNDHYWVMDADGQNIHRLDPEDGIVEQSAPAWGRR